MILMGETVSAQCKADYCCENVCKCVFASVSVGEADDNPDALSSSGNESDFACSRQGICFWRSGCNNATQIRSGPEQHYGKHVSADDNSASQSLHPPIVSSKLFTLSAHLLYVRIFLALLRESKMQAE